MFGKKQNQVEQEIKQKVLEDKINNIPIYQCGIEEISKQLGKNLKLVDTGNPDKYIMEFSYSAFALRKQAYELGADIIVNFVFFPDDSPSISKDNCWMGTPVKYIR